MREMMIRHFFLNSGGTALNVLRAGRNEENMKTAPTKTSKIEKTFTTFICFYPFFNRADDSSSVNIPTGKQ